MKTLATGLQAHLDSGATTLAMCWKIVRADGAVYGFTEHDRALAFDGVTYEAESAFQRSAIAQSIGIAVDSHDVLGAISSSALVESDIIDGRWDAAEVTVYLVNWADVAMRQTVFRGQVGRMARGDLAFRAEVRSLVDRLAQRTGRVFGYFCDAALGDARCGIDLTSATYRATGSVGAGPTPRGFILSGVSGYSDGWFTGGLVTITSGALSGLAREIKSHSITGSAHSVALWAPLPASPAFGDTLTVTAGCDKTWATCRDRFGNGDRFRGFPHIPGTDRVTDYPREGERLDGGSFFI